jgi:hypothetical protein
MLVGPSLGVKYYLIAYNVISCLGWLVVLIATLAHLFNLSTHPPPSRLAQLFNAARTPKPPRWLPTSIHPLFKRACTTFAVGRVGPIVRFVQTGALLEVLHVLLGMVRSPLVTTAMQVASRIYLVWGVTESFSAVSNCSKCTRTYGYLFEHVLDRHAPTRFMRPWYSRGLSPKSFGTVFTRSILQGANPVSLCTFGEYDAYLTA